MKMIGTLALLLLLVVPVFGQSTVYVNSDSNYVASLTWGAGGLPAQPNYCWQIGQGIRLDTTTTVFVNYGTTTLTTGLGIGNAPALAEGFCAPGQRAGAFNGTSNYLYINSATALAPGANDFAAFVWARWTDTTTRMSFFGKFDVTNQYAWLLYTSLVTPGGVRVILSQGAASGEKIYDSAVTFNDGKPHLVGFTWISNVLVVYVDGAAITPIKTADLAMDSIYANTAQPAIGCRWTTGAMSNYAAADMSWVGYWQGGLTPATAIPTAAQVLALYTAMTPTGTLTKPFPSIQGAVFASNNKAAGSRPTTIAILPGLYKETVSVVNDSLILTAYNSAFGSRPVIYGAALLPYITAAIGVSVEAKTQINFLDIRGYSAGRGIRDTTYIPATYGSCFDHLTIDSCLTGIRVNTANTPDTIWNCTIDGAGLAGSRGVLAVCASNVTITYRNNGFVNCDTASSELVSAGSLTRFRSNNGFYGNRNNWTHNTGAVALASTDQTLPPYYIAQATNDYRLSGISAWIDKGVSVGLPYQDCAPDIGAYETAPALMMTGRRTSWGGRADWGR